MYRLCRSMHGSNNPNPRFRRAGVWSVRGYAESTVNRCYITSRCAMKSVIWTLSVFVCLAFPVADGKAADTWVDISSPQIDQFGKHPWPGGCAGTVVNRLNGDVLVNMV